MPLFVGASESYDTDAWEAYNLKAENAKLREFVADLMAYLKEAERVHGDSLIPDLYYDRARELGVEVKQWKQ